MTLPRWTPERSPTKQEQFLLRRLLRTRKLFGFLREHRHELFDDAFQEELESMYRSTGAGKAPVPPALMAMAVLLQGYVGASDAEAVELTIVDLRWQMVLGRLGATEPAFSQGALHDFRHRLISADMDRRLLERTVELARTTGGFDPKKLPKTLRIAMDSSPLEGACRVEDTFNLLGHAARKVVACVAEVLGWTADEVCAEAGIPVLLESSVKKALDVEWSDPVQKGQALQVLVGQLAALQRWIEKNLPSSVNEPPLNASLQLLRTLVQQDLEPDPGGGGGGRIRQGVAPDRRVSIEDAEMRHGRKSKSKRFNGFKRHIAADLDTNLILACNVTPANRPEDEAAPTLLADIKRQNFSIGELFIDRGYIASPVVNDVLGIGGDVVCKPWIAHNPHGFSKANFRLNMRDMTITCPAGHVEPIRLGMVVEFEPSVCDACPMRAQCTTAALGAGRTVTIAEDEMLQHRLRKRSQSPKGRQRLRKRTAIEHRLAHIGRRQGRRARYRGVRRNLFDLRRAASLQNLETTHRSMAA